MISGSLLAASSAAGAVNSAQYFSRELSYGWSQPLVWLHASSDALAIVAYGAIPVVLLGLCRRRPAGPPFRGMLTAFAVSVLACGAVQALELWNLWHADFWVAGVVKAAAAAAAVVAAVMLVRLFPVLVRLPAASERAQIDASLAAAHASLQASEEMFRAFMDNSPVAAWIVTAEGVYHYANHTVRASVSAPGPLVGQRLRDLFPPHLAEEYERQNRAVLERGQPCEMESRMQHGVAQIHMFPVRTADGRLMVGGIGVDITERHRASETLRQQGELLSGVTAAMRAYLEDADWKTAHGLLLRCALRLTGSEFGFIAITVEKNRLRVLAHEGVRWDDFFGAGFTEQLQRGHPQRDFLEFPCGEHLFCRVARTGQVLIENAPAAEDGAPALRSFMGLPVLHEKEVVGLVALANRADGYSAAMPAQLDTLLQQAGVLCDSYRRDLREAALEEQLRTSQKMEAIGLLAGGVAHDFNNLLQVIHGYTAFALDPAAPWAERRASLDQVKAAADRATQLTQQLLAFGRQQTLQKTDLDLNQSVTELLRMLRRLIGEQIAVDFIPGHDLGNVNADRAQIDQILLNLCLNARDALPHGGRITIETENVLVNGAFRESHPWARPGRYVLIAVSDDGVGMDKDTVTHVFEPFFTTKAKGKGTGLGLSVVYGVVKQHDGMVHVYSEPGKGSTFKIYLPIVERAASSVGPKHAPPPARGTETILLAEDEPMVRELAFRILTRAGYKVIAAEDGVEACAAFEAHHDEIALLVLDVVMPHLGGREVYEKIAAQRPGMPVIFCSGYAGSALAADALHAPGTHLLAKPYGADEMLQRVRTALDRR